MSEADLVKATEQFSANLRRLRLAAGLTQTALGARVGVHQSEISRFEGAERNPELETILRLARGLETSAGRLLAGIG
jgi:transcriptional regulator with XRE-family HTH domain